MRKIWARLTKPTPDNLSIVGPRFSGKTVIMKALAERAAGDSSPYSFVLNWHLGHVAPRTDDEFVTELCELLKKELARSRDDYGDHVAYLADHTLPSLKEVTDDLHSRGKAILMLWDGLDKPLSQGGLTDQLWDRVRTIFEGKIHKVVVVTRGPIAQRARTHDISPFWNLFFMNVVRVGPFDDADCDAILDKVSGRTFEKGAKTELLGWSGGFPPLMLGLVNQVAADVSAGAVDNEAVNRAVPGAREWLSEIMARLWEDSPSTVKDLYFDLARNGELPFSSAGTKEEGDWLTNRGFAKQAGNKLVPSCRMMQQHVSDLGYDMGAVARLFGTSEDYEANIRGLLEHRLAHVSPFDDRLQRLVARAIEDIPRYPDDCLNNLTGIEDRALDLIWQREFGQGKIVPRDVVDAWAAEYPHDRAVQSLQDQGVVPSDRSHQCGVLQLLTGSRQRVEAHANYVSKNSYVLINAIHSFRNRSQHAEGQSMEVGVAVAALMLCIELLACLERELGR